jgi:hypothetical protein
MARLAARALIAEFSAKGRAGLLRRRHPRQRGEIGDRLEMIRENGAHLAGLVGVVGGDERVSDMGGKNVTATLVAVFSAGQSTKLKI